MKWLLNCVSLLCVLLLLIATKWQHAEALPVLVGDSVEFETHCPDGSKLMTGDYKVTAANKVNGTWIGEGRYDGRIGSSTSSSVVLTDVQFNDKGLYESSCGDTRYDLQVVVPDDESVREGQQIRLKCHLETDDSAEVVKWEKDGKSVMNITRSGLTSNGTGLERRQVSPDCFQTGNFSLSIEEARKEDAGVYRCSFQRNGETQWGEPAAVRVEVSERANAMPDSVRTPCPPPVGWITATAVLAAVVVLALVLVVIVFWCRRPRRPEASPESPDEGLPLQSRANGVTLAG